MLAKISVARHKRETNHSKLICPCTAPFSIQPWQDGPFLAKIRPAFGWISGPYSFSAATSRSFLSILERGACSPPGPGFRRACVYIGQWKYNRPPPGRNKGPKKRSKWAKKRKIFRPINQIFFLSYIKKVHFCTKNPKSRYHSRR